MGTISRVMDRADDPLLLPAKTVPRATEEPTRISNCVRADILLCCEVPLSTFHTNCPHLLDAFSS